MADKAAILPPYVIQAHSALALNSAVHQVQGPVQIAEVEELLYELRDRQADQQAQAAPQPEQQTFGELWWQCSEIGVVDSGAKDDQRVVPRASCASLG